MRFPDPYLNLGAPSTPVQQNQVSSNYEAVTQRGQVFQLPRIVGTYLYMKDAQMIREVEGDHATVYEYETMEGAIIHLTGGFALYMSLTDLLAVKIACEQIQQMMKEYMRCPLILGKKHLRKIVMIEPLHMVHCIEDDECSRVWRKLLEHSLIRKLSAERLIFKRIQTRSSWVSRRQAYMEKKCTLALKYEMENARLKKLTKTLKQKRTDCCALKVEVQRIRNDIANIDCEIKRKQKKSEDQMKIVRIQLCAYLRSIIGDTPE